MAQITPPDYSKVSSRQKVYNVRPAEEQYRGPDENVGQVDLSTGKIIDAVSNSLEVFSRIYAQSKQTADSLQAKGILVEKAKDNQRLKELIALNIGSTAPEHLVLENVLEDVRTIDGTGKTNLNIGKGREHNISPMQMPEVNDNVLSMIEPQWVREEIGLINYIIDEVGRVQGEQIEGMLDFTINEFHQAYINDTRNNSDKKTRRELLANHLNVVFAEIDNLGYLGTYNPNQVRKQKDKVIQKALTAEFRSDILLEGNRNTAIANADKGEYKYKMDDGRIISLSRATIKPYIDQQIDQQYKLDKGFDAQMNLNEIGAFIQTLEKSQQDNAGKFLLDYGVWDKDKEIWNFSDEKIDADPVLHRYMLSQLKKFTDKNGNIKPATEDQKRKIKKGVLHTLFLRAIKDLEAEIEKQGTEIIEDSTFNKRYIPSIIEEHQVSIIERVQYGKKNPDKITKTRRETRRLPLKDKKLTQPQLAQVYKLDDHAERMAVIAENVNNWSLEELKKKIIGLNAEIYFDNNYSQLRDLTKGFLIDRINEFKTNIAEIQLKESSKHNENILAGGEGEYIWEDVAKWQKSHGIVNNDKVIPESMLVRIEEFKDKGSTYLEKKDLMDHYSALARTFGDKYPTAHRQISKSLQRQRMDLVELFANWDDYDVARKITMSEDVFLIKAE